MNGKELLGVQACLTDILGNSWKVSMGATEPDQVNPLLDHHLLRIGSVTKIYTTALIMKLMEDEYPTLDQETSEYFPGRENVDGVTIRNLLNHSSGIADIFTIPAGGSFIIGKRKSKLDLSCLPGETRYKSAADNQSMPGWEELGTMK